MINFNNPDYEPKPAQFATEFKCGSVEKVEIMRIRLQLGQSLYHPDDNPVKIDLTQYEIAKMNKLTIRMFRIKGPRRSATKISNES
jgi:hypothetical protein